jgi:hypothetical protein
MWVLGLNVLSRGITDSAIACGAAAGLALGAFRVQDGSMAMAGLLMILLLGTELFRPMRELRSVLHQGMVGMAAAKGILAILADEPLVGDALPPPVVGDAPPLLVPPVVDVAAAPELPAVGVVPPVLAPVVAVALSSPPPQAASSAPMAAMPATPPLSRNTSRRENCRPMTNPGRGSSMSPACSLGKSLMLGLLPHYGSARRGRQSSEARLRPSTVAGGAPNAGHASATRSKCPAHHRTVVARCYFPPRRRSAGRLPDALSGAGANHSAAVAAAVPGAVNCRRSSHSSYPSQPSIITCLPSHARRV